jgi:hypothetical protein
MRTRLELTRFGLRILGVCLLLWCWWQVVGMLSMIAGAALVGNWKVAQIYLQSGWGDATRFVTQASGPIGQPAVGLNWPVLTWWFRLGLGLWLVFWNAGLARQLWRGIANDARCPHCGYDRTGIASGAACPECGKSGT